MHEVNAVLFLFRRMTRKRISDLEKMQRFDAETKTRYYLDVVTDVALQLQIKGQDHPVGPMDAPIALKTPLRTETQELLKIFW